MSEKRWDEIPQHDSSEHPPTDPTTRTSAPPPPPPKDGVSKARLDDDDDDDYDDGSDLDFGDDLLKGRNGNGNGHLRDGHAVRESMMFEEGDAQDHIASTSRVPLWMRGSTSQGKGEGRWRRCLRARVVVPSLLGLVLVGSAISGAAAPDKARSLASSVLPGVFGPADFVYSGKPSRYAFATYVSGYDWTEPIEPYVGARDQFVDGARLINYQLRHAPSTRSRPNVDFVVLVGDNVTQADREALRREGARVVAAEPLTPTWVSEWYGDGRWGTVMDKFTLAKMDEYEKMCFLDADMIIHRPLDGVFQDPATAIVPNVGNAGRVNKDDAPEPAEYMFAAVRDRKQNDSDATTEDFTYLNAGFFCWHPSQAAFDYYMRFLNRKNSFFPIYPEQNMLNIVHNPRSNLPFTRLNWEWNAHRPRWIDLIRGIRSFHAKGWLPSGRYEMAYPELYRIWWYQKREMESYYADLGIHDRLSPDGTGLAAPEAELGPEPYPVVDPPKIDWPYAHKDDWVYVPEDGAGDGEGEGESEAGAGGEGETPAAEGTTEGTEKTTTGGEAASVGAGAGGNATGAMNATMVKRSLKRPGSRRSVLLPSRDGGLERVVFDNWGMH